MKTQADRSGPGADTRLYQQRKSQAYADGLAEAAKTDLKCRDRSELLKRYGMHPLVDAYFSGRRDGQELLPSSQEPKS